MADVCREIEKLNIEFCRDIMLSTICTFKIGGKANIVAYPLNTYELTELINIAYRFGLRHEIVGNASNILFDDDGFDGIIICTKNLTANKIIINENNISVACGIKLSSLAIAARDASLSGLEFAYGIPGTVGGAIAMNAGAYGGEMADVVSGISVLDKNSGEFYFVDAENLNFSYRKNNSA